MSLIVNASFEKSRDLLKWLACLLVVGVLLSCASTERVAYHAFSFDIRRAIPTVDVIDYRYGTSGLPGVRADKGVTDTGAPSNWTGVTGPMTVGDSLYVKWRLKETGEVFEKTIDLRKRLPRDMKDQRVAFYIIGAQLYIYLADISFLPPGAPNPIVPGTPSQTLPYTYHTKYRIIYPDQSKS